MEEIGRDPEVWHVGEGDATTATCAGAFSQLLAVMFFPFGNVWMFPTIGVEIPQNGWLKIMENPIRMDDLGYHYFWKHPYGHVFPFYTKKCWTKNSQNSEEPKGVETSSNVGMLDKTSAPGTG